ncbi:MAG: sigma-70 family RNA polymerase sigma factor [Chloroflexota bacterium]|jgi:RNA polymerase sigma-70 factor (ECF subfamily)
MSNIQEVVRRCQEGQLDAFTTLFRHYQNHVYGLACAILRDEAAAEDIVQDTFLAVFQHITSYRGDSTFKTWLTAVVVNQCRMRLRRRKISQALSLEQLSPGRLFRSGGKREDLSDVVHRRQQRQTLWEMVDQLPDSLRLPMILRYRYALPCPDIAVILNKRKSTIYQQLKEGRRELEKMAQQVEMRDSPPALKKMPGLE